MRHPLHDYSQAAGYFVTTVTAHRACILGERANSAFSPSRYGSVVHDIWLSLPEYFPGLTLDAFQLMPDHLHAILIITHLPASPGIAVKQFGLSQVMQVLKRNSARRINELRGTPGQTVWQEGFMDRIIRNDGELQKFRNYILNNPLRR